MGNRESKSLVEHVERSLRLRPAVHDAFIPFDIGAMFPVLAGEIIRITADDPGEGLILAMDGETAATTALVELAASEAVYVLIVGDVPPALQGMPNVRQVPFSDEDAEPDYFAVALSSTVALAAVGSHFSKGPDTLASFYGGWTGLRSRVAPFLEAVSTYYGQQESQRVAALPAEVPEVSAGHVVHLANVVAQQLVTLQHDTAMDKDDLFSVLEILKAISARRRSHDILFVFVEQIASVVQMERCSVVRVWGGDNAGHVLASHEDEHVADLSIDLTKYPEVREALTTRSKVVIDDVREDEITRTFAPQLIRAGIQSLVVIPITLLDPTVGSLLLRAARSNAPFSRREISFFEILAEAAANALERAHLFEGIQKANERLELLAITDGLTGLFNHRHFRTRLESEFERARRYSSPLACMIFDIDNFKKINDTFGHLQGDRILKDLASRVMHVTRRTDIVARYGGEEFAVIMPQTAIEGAKAQAERLLEEVRSKEYQGMPPGYPVTVSIGVTVLDHDAMLDCEALIRAADSALYEAKNNGKNRVVVATT